MWEACYDVKMGATGTTVYSLFGWDESPEAWFDYMGDPEEYSPYLLEFEFVKESNMSLSIPYHLCNSTTYACACADCKDVCDLSAPPYTPPDDSECAFSIGDVRVTCHTAWIASIFSLISLAAAVYLGFSHKRKVVQPGYVYGSFANDYANTQAPTSAQAHTSRMEQKFYELGVWVSRWSYVVIGGWVFFSSMMSYGIVFTEIETDPVNMWVAPGSTAKQRRDDFDTIFDPFYRIEQAIISTPDGSEIVTRSNFEKILGMQERVAGLVAEFEGRNFTLDDICNKPVRGLGCLLTTPLAWFQNSRERFDEFETDEEVREHVAKCAIEQASTQCRSELDFTQDPKVCLGGYDDELRNYVNSTAIVVTFLVDNLADDLERNKAWETVFLAEMERGLDGLRVSYSSERSIEDEINENNNGDLGIIAVSYIVMFLYVGFALGHPPSVRELHKHTRFLLAFEGVMILVTSMSIAAGVWGYMGVKPTLIHFQVIPFLILSIGLDNCFIMVDVLDATDPSFSAEHRVGQVLATVGVSMTASAGSEALAFLLGALTEMPAVQSFALYTTVAIMATYVLQITVFGSFLMWDVVRQQKNQMDCFVCFEGSQVDESVMLRTPGALAARLQKERAAALVVDPQQGIVRNWFRGVFAPVLLRPGVRAVVIVGCLLLSLLSALSMQELPQGLEQELALPRESYLQDYFEDFKFLKSGAPTYFVVSGVDFSQPEEQDKVCTLTDCNSNSLGNIVNGAQGVPDESYYAVALTNWVDDYLLWLKFGFCCRINPETGEFCPPPDQCEPTPLACQGCTECVLPEDLDAKGRPPPEVFNRFLNQFLESQCSDDCGVCGVAYQANVAQDANGTVVASRFMTYHTNLQTQEDFISAFNSANDINKLAKNENDMDVFPYSMFYVFFEQYVTIVNTALLTVGLGLLSVLLLSWYLLRNPAVVCAVVLSMGMLLADLVGVMYVWGIDLNALSVVNLVMAVGIAVEFCVHLGASFCKGDSTVRGGGTAVERAHAALVAMGSNVLMGIAMTNCSAIVLAFAESKIFEVQWTTTHTHPHTGGRRVC
eukprot:TRINITY_DN1013_c0_g1_i1.p1 TRINITY_DN1013_c0_g1~~TRINITY_DN1013_c0_g1_i1.p1  ORF type:complete len:1204 (-),score=311.60 TRINITY_DN1013_c0_g1_i1:46-3216(-)